MCSRFCIRYLLIDTGAVFQPCLLTLITPIFSLFTGRALSLKYISKYLPVIFDKWRAIFRDLDVKFTDKGMLHCIWLQHTIEFASCARNAPVGHQCIVGSVVEFQNLHIVWEAAAAAAAAESSGGFFVKLAQLSSSKVFYLLASQVWGAAACSRCYEGFGKNPAHGATTVERITWKNEIWLVHISYVSMMPQTLQNLLIHFLWKG